VDSEDLIEAFKIYVEDDNEHLQGSVD
nr:RecName: Full=Beta-hexosaminidase; AltName: Full=Beta-GlcNAcase; AltName: Full=Beta-N-acetylhexosaminidase; Short=Beta-NAHase; AltName: Full=N-acetyl-beta-glucosaminidase [Lupinus albus]